MDSTAYKFENSLLLCGVCCSGNHYIMLSRGYFEQVGFDFLVDDVWSILQIRFEIPCNMFSISQLWAVQLLLDSFLL